MTPHVYDVHSHPVFPYYYKKIKENGLSGEDGFPVPADYTIDKHLALMDEAHIQWSLLTLSSPHPYYGDVDACVKICRNINEEAAAAKQKYPGRFGFSATLPHPAMDAAVKEAVYALDELKADAVKLASNVQGLYMGDPSMRPLFHELNKRHAVITMHPHKPAPINDTVWTSGPVPVFEFLCDTTRAVLNMITEGVFEQYPNLRLIVPHCGSFLPNIYDRFTAIVSYLSDKGEIQYVDLQKSMNNLYFDTSGDPFPHNLPFLLTITQPDHIMYGSDFPFTPAKSVKEKMEVFLNGLEESASLREHKDLILKDNAIKLFALSDAL